MNQPPPPPDDPDPNGLENQEPIREPERIAELLTEIQRHRLRLGATFGEEGGSHDVRLARLDREGGRIFLEALQPEADPARWRPGQPLRLDTHVRGMALRFETRVAGPPPNDQGHHGVAFPDAIQSLRRRDLLRVPVPVEARRRVSLRGRTADEEIQSRILDLSAKGFCVEVEARWIARHRVGDAFVYFDLELPGRRIKSSGEAILVNLRPAPEASHRLAGFEITDLDPASERALMRAVLDYQREARRRGR